jgi:ferrous iron transport protein A
LRTTIYSLKKGDKAIIKDFDIDIIPLKLLEMGCLPGNTVELFQIAPLDLYLNINVPIWLFELKQQEIEVELIKIKL